MSRRSARPRLIVAAVAATFAALSACSVNNGATTGSGNGSNADGGSSQAVARSVARVHGSIPSGAHDVDLSKPVTLRVRSGTFRSVEVTGPQGAHVRGRLSAGKTRWVSTTPLQASSRYLVVSTAVDAQGRTKSYRSSFRTRALSLDEQTYPSFVPVENQTVGVGMPVIIRFDVPVTDRASIQRHLQVISRPAQVGAFHWVSSQEVHWRPRSFWRPGTDVTVKAAIAGVPAGNGIYGQKDRELHFTVGRSMISKVDMNTDQMRVFENGKLLRTIPITTGRQPDFTTRSGIKVIVEKFRHKRMNSETIGIDPNSADGYNLDDVEYAMRVTYSGEFVHAAPWSVADQGHRNVSHGCTGMSPENAAWLYDRSLVGDVVEYTGTSRQMTLTNGFGDWNASFADYRSGAAS